MSRAHEGVDFEIVNTFLLFDFCDCSHSITHIEILYIAIANYLRGVIFDTKNYL